MAPWRIADEGLGMGQAAPNRWRERPVVGAALQAALTLLPLLGGVGVGLAVSRYVLPGRVDGEVTRWVIAGTAAMITVWTLQPLMRRFLPLAWLLKLGMLWPGQAPSRYKIARRAGRINDLEERLVRARQHRLDGDAEHAAELILSLTAALTAHDRRTRGHAERVRIFTDLLAIEMGLSRHDRDRLRWSALLHDIGKLEVSERVLNKRGKPSPREWEQLHAHPEAGDRIIEPLRDWLGEWADATLHHHERWDGTGYPHGLEGGQISRAGRIVAVADSYEVMTAARTYKRPMSAAAARQELAECSGSQFDPSVVRMFLLVPIWRLRWALGPFAWVAQLPLARDVVHAGSSVGALAPATGAAAGATAIIVGSSLGPTSDPGMSMRGLEGLELARHHLGSADGSTSASGRGSTTDDGGPRSGTEAPDGSATDGPRVDRGFDDHIDRDGSASPPPAPDATMPHRDLSPSEDPSQPGTEDDPIETVDDAVDGLTDAVGDVVDDTTDTLDEVVDDTIDTLDQVVDGTTGTVDEVVDDTTSTVDEVVDDTTGTVDEVVEDTTGTVDEDTTEAVEDLSDDVSGAVGGLLGR